MSFQLDYVFESARDRRSLTPQRIHNPRHVPPPPPLKHELQLETFLVSATSYIQQGS